MFFRLLDILDGQDRPASLFVSGEPLKIRLLFTMRAEVDTLVIGIRNKEGQAEEDLTEVSTIGSRLPA